MEQDRLSAADVAIQLLQNVGCQAPTTTSNQLGPMAIRRLTPATLETLRVLEKRLGDAVDSAEADRALGVVAEIQELFSGDRSHHRLLRAKLRAFEACLDNNRLQYAESGFVGVRR